MKSDWRAWLFLLSLFLTGILICDQPAKAESAIVSFDDAEHLAAISDSIVGVCDTTWNDGMRLYNPFPRDTSWIQGAVGHDLVDITCRELVFIAVPAPPMPVDSSTVTQTYIGRSPGTAIITWREVKP